MLSSPTFEFIPERNRLHVIDQANRTSIVHLEAEIPAECDKSFTRADALQKHMKTVHSEILPPTRKPARKRKAGELESLDGDDLIKDEDLDSGSLMGDTMDGQSDAGAFQTVMAQDSYEDDGDHVKLALSQHPDQDPDFVRYVVLLAQQSYLANERDALSAEMDALQRKEDQLATEKDKLLQQVLDKELGSEAWRLVGPLADNAFAFPFRSVYPVTNHLAELIHSDGLLQRGHRYHS